MFAALRSAWSALPQAPSALAGQVRGLKRRTIAKAMWPGWPVKAPDGWKYARHLKKVYGDKYISKQAYTRLMGKQKGACPHARPPPPHAKMALLRRVVLPHPYGRRELSCPARKDIQRARIQCSWCMGAAHTQSK